MAEELKFVTEWAIVAVWGLCLALVVGFGFWTAIVWLWDHWMRFSFHFTDTIETGRCIKRGMAHPKLQISTK